MTPVHLPLQLPVGAAANAAPTVGAARGVAADLGIGALVVAVALCAVLLVRVVRSEAASRPVLPDRNAGLQDLQRTLAARFVAGGLSAREYVEQGSALDWAPGPEWSPPTAPRRPGPSPARPGPPRCAAGTTG